MNPYALHARPGPEHQRFFEALREWHDEMVLHQRSVGRLGARLACSEECPHAEGRRLWREAVALLGPGAESLTFLRDCARPAARPTRSTSRPAALA